MLPCENPGIQCGSAAAAIALASPIRAGLASHGRPTRLGSPSATTYGIPSRCRDAGRTPSPG